MKKAFTMIELIFVIVVLGILAAVAVPKLVATRDDAELSRIASDAKTVIKDIIIYYNSQGKFATKIQDMTNVSLKIWNTDTPITTIKNETKSGTIRYKNKNCIYFDLSTAFNNGRNGVTSIKTDLTNSTTDNGGITSSSTNTTTTFSSSAFFRIGTPGDNDTPPGCKKAFQLATGLTGDKVIKYYDLAKSISF